MSARLGSFVAWAFSLALALPGSAPAQGEDRAERALSGVTPAQSRIFGGVRAERWVENAVVGLHDTRGNNITRRPFCTGTVFDKGRRFVATAAHCVDRGTGRRPSAISPDQVSVSLRGTMYAARVVWMNPRFSRSSLENDVAIIEVAKPIQGAQPIAPLPAALGLGRGDVGEPLTCAGYGENNTSHRDGVLLQTPPGEVRIRSVNNHHFEYGQDQSGTCYGDSGGPCFIERDGIPYVAGTTSYGDQNCTEYGVNQRWDTMEAVVAAFLPQDGDDVAPGLDPGGDDDPTPDPGCGNGICEVGESCDGRSQTEACPQDCPSYDGRYWWYQYCFVDGECEGRGCRYVND